MLAAIRWLLGIRRLGQVVCLNDGATMQHMQDIAGLECPRCAQRVGYGQIELSATVAEVNTDE